ncbi:MAG: hypothetical protein WAV15_02585 [Minisyncoccia bacterium]
MEPDKKLPKMVVETYAEDMAEVLENDREGLVKKIIHGQEEEEARKKNLSPESRQNKLFMEVSIFLLILGVATLVYFMLNSGPKTVPVEKQFTPIIFNDKTSFIEVSELKKEALEQTVLNQINKTSVKTRGVEGVYLTFGSQRVGLRQFLTLIKSSLVLPKQEELVSDDFLMGVVNVGAEEGSTNRDGFFILIKVRNVIDIFDSMRAWEPKMFLDLYGFLGYQLNPDTSYLLTKDFEEGIVENKNARLLYDKDKNLVLMYVFGDDNSVIVTNSEDAVKEIVLRIASKKTKE